ncbi:hypothetical protein LOTGIDRAFT_140092, partial [Lottia gigantea]
GLFTIKLRIQGFDHKIRAFTSFRTEPKSQNDQIWHIQGFKRSLTVYPLRL